MDLDYDSVRALASPTRLKILNMVLEEEATTTKISDKLDKSKSTVSSHLKVLTESGLLEKDDEKGRRRVIYRPTDKAEAIVEGRERKVKFSIVSSALTGAGGLFLINSGIKGILDQGQEVYQESLNSGSGGSMSALDVGGKAVPEAARTANQTTQKSGEVMQMVKESPEMALALFTGSLLGLITLLLVAYAIAHVKIGSGEEKKKGSEK